MKKDFHVRACVRLYEMILWCKIERKNGRERKEIEKESNEKTNKNENTHEAHT
jgi:hypothetical protein